MSYLANFKDKINLKLKEKEDDKKKSSTKELKETQNYSTDNQLQNNNKTSNINVVTKANTNSSGSKMKNLNSTGILEATKDDDPIAKLEEIEDRIDYLDFYDVPESLGLQTKDVPEYDEDKVRAEIQTELNKKKDDSINKITTNYDSEVGLLKDKKETLTDEKIENQKIINEIYDNESLKLESQAIKRGLARSSIILGQLANVENKRAIELSDNLNALNSGIAEIENKMADLIKNRDSALENLDIEYAEELENKLQESKNEYKKAVDEVIEFNNQVKKLESEYKMDYENNKLDWKEGVLDLTQYGYDEFRKRIQNAKYDYMVSYLSQFPKSEAISILVSNTNFKDLLGGDYSKVYEYLLSR